MSFPQQKSEYYKPYKGIATISTYTYAKGLSIPFFAELSIFNFSCTADSFFNPRVNSILFSSANLGVNSLAYIYVKIVAIPLVNKISDLDTLFMYLNSLIKYIIAARWFIVTGIRIKIK
ncbi:hypothetical protein METP1_00618 [Methanosarcinales archaeon]|nr:hypothetical protein METP1_00618 [Methanosarcinales archaeon]